MTDLEGRKKLLKDRQEKYYSLRGKIRDMRYILEDIFRTRGTSAAYIASVASLELLQGQIHEDYLRYERRFNKATQRDDVASIQKALNRERLKREALESKIEEAKTSSGLFIKYVKSKLNV